MRSLLFVPGHDSRKLNKGLDSGADALIVDLEDAVPDSEKNSARALAAEFVSTYGSRLPLFVRVNSLTSNMILDDLASIVKARPYGIMLPKCDGGKSVALLDSYLADFETREGLSVGTTRILPIVTETASAMLNFPSYANSSPRLWGMLWGGEDLAADIGATANRDSSGNYTSPYALARTLTLLSASANEVCPVDAVYTNFRDPNGLSQEVALAVRDGFSSKAAIHPDQIPIINEGFTPSHEEIAFAKKIIVAFESAPQSGAISLDGKMLDRPHLRSAHRILSRANLVRTS